MKIKLTRNTVVAGSVYPAGATVETSDKIGNYLIHIGKAEAVGGSKAEKAVAKAAENAADPKTSKGQKAEKPEE